MAIEDAGVQPDARHHRGVGTDHHHLAMGHVDDAHGAVGDGETQRHQQQNGAETQADEQTYRSFSASHRVACGRRTARRPLMEPNQVFLSFAVSSPLDGAEQIVVGLAVRHVGQRVDRRLIVVDDLALAVRLPLRNARRQTGVQVLRLDLDVAVRRVELLALHCIADGGRA